MIRSINPTTEKVQKEIQEISKDDITTKISLSHDAFLSWKNVSMSDRAELFLCLGDVLLENKEKYAKTITKEMGKPFSQSLAEIDKCILNCEYYANHSHTLLQPENVKIEKASAHIQFDPLGVIFFVMPWNFPFWQVLRQAVPTMMAGNTVVLKHASNVPLCALLLEQAMKKAGFPKNTFQTLMMSARDSETVLKDFRVKGVSLTGSVGAGSKVASLAGKHIKKSVMELGGSDPFIVLPDAHVKNAARAGAQSRLNCNGQTCISAKRFIVHEDIYEEFLSEHLSAFEEIVVGNPSKEGVTLGPLSSLRAVEDIEKQVKKSVKKGAKIVVGGSRVNRTGYYFEPTILVNVGPGMPAYDDEIFGPVSSIIVVSSESEAVAVANDTVFGLGASIWTKNKERARELASEINAGFVAINDIVKSDSRLPFGGVNHGGFGRELGEYGIKEFTNIKTVVAK